MRRPLIIATAAGAVLAAGVAAGPALAATGQPTPGTGNGTQATCPLGNEPGTGPGYGAGTGGGYGRGNGMMGRGGMGAGSGMGAGQGQGRGMGGGTVDPLAGLAKGTLTADQKAALASMAEEEKLAHDVYVALAATSKDARFTRIAAAESRHLTEVRALLTRYGVSDLTAGKADGVFASADRQQQYTELVARGDDSLAAALAVGRDIENADIADLAKAGAGVTAADVSTVYTRLSRGSQMHLRAFGGTPAATPTATS